MTTPVRSTNDRLMLLLWPLVALLFWLLSFSPLNFTSLDKKSTLVSPKAPQNNSPAFLVSFQEEEIQNEQASEASENVLLHIEAEDFNQISGIRTEICNDFGGGWNISRINDNDYCSYQIHIPYSGMYQFHFRVASATSGGSMAVFLNQASLFDLEIGNTEGWQEWITLHHEARLEAGDHNINLQFSGEEGFLINLNWFEMELMSNSLVKTKLEDSEWLELEMIPHENFWSLHLKNQLDKFSSLEIKDLNGQIIFTQLIADINTGQTILLPKEKIASGVYWLFLRRESYSINRKLLIL